MSAIPRRHFLPGAWELFRLGIAHTMIQALAEFTGLFVNRSLLLHGAPNSVAVWNIVQKLYTLLLMPVVGITQGIQTIIAYFDGHGQSEQNQKTILMPLAGTVACGLAATAAVFYLGEQAPNSIDSFHFITRSLQPS